MQCLKCGHTRTPDDQGPDYACPKCQAVYAKVAVAVADQRKLDQDIEQAKKTGNWAGIDPKRIQQEAAKITLTTTDFVPGFDIEKAMGIVSTDYVFAFGAIYEAVAGLARNVAGSGASSKTSELLRNGRTQVAQSLCLHCIGIGADAVIGVRYDYEEFSGANGHGVLAVIATGTAVKLHPRTTP